MTPYVLHTRSALSRALGGAIQEPEDRGFLFRQPHFPGVGAGQHLGTRPETIGTDRKHRVLAGFMLAELRPDPRQQHREAKWLCHIIIGAGFEPKDGVRISIVAGEHDDGSLEPALA